MSATGPLLIRHEGHTPRERSTCGWRDRLISREDAELAPASWAHEVEIDGAKPDHQFEPDEADKNQNIVRAPRRAGPNGMEPAP